MFMYGSNGHVYRKSIIYKIYSQVSIFTPCKYLNTCAYCTYYYAADCKNILFSVQKKKMKIRKFTRYFVRYTVTNNNLIDADVIFH